MDDVTDEQKGVPYIGRINRLIWTIIYCVENEKKIIMIKEHPQMSGHFESDGQIPDFQHQEGRW